MSRLWSKVSDWQKEMEDLETRVRIADNREMFKNLGISPELLWTPPGYVEEADAQ